MINVCPAHCVAPTKRHHLPRPPEDDPVGQDGPQDSAQIGGCSTRSESGRGWGKKALIATTLAVALATSGCATYGGYGYYGQSDAAAVLTGAVVGAVVGGAISSEMSNPYYSPYNSWPHNYRPNSFQPCYVCY